MTRHFFLVRLFVVQVLFLAIAAWLIWQAQYALACVYVLMVWWLTRLINRTLDPDPKTEINGEILTILAEYNAAKVRTFYRTDWEAEHKRIEELEQEFRARIEIDPDDHRCLYRWKKGV